MEQEQDPTSNPTASESVESPAQDSLEQQLAEAKAQILYERADLENFRKRILRDQESSIRFANERLIKEIMPIVDLLDRALQTGELEKNQASGLVSGVALTRKELESMLARQGVELIGKTGEPFDPQRHEAISEQDSPDVPPRSVLQVLQRGCLLHGRLLQPARVVVSTGETVQQS